MTNKFTESEKNDIIKSQSDEIERLNSEIGCLQIERDSHIEGFELLKKFMTVLFDETFPQEKMDVINNSDKITVDEITEAFQLIEIDCEVR
jgi:hypothetical protein